MLSEWSAARKPSLNYPPTLLEPSDRTFWRVPVFLPRILAQPFRPSAIYVPSESLRIFFTAATAAAASLVSGATTFWAAESNFIAPNLYGS